VAISLCSLATIVFSSRTLYVYIQYDDSHKCREVASAPRTGFLLFLRQFAKNDKGCQKKITLTVNKCHFVWEKIVGKIRET
jgi:hypothetical protein